MEGWWIYVYFELLCNLYGYVLDVLRICKFVYEFGMCVVFDGIVGILFLV